jgi:CRISPR-associated protein Cas1
MQKQPFYITQSGTLSRKDNSLWFENETVKKAIPIEAVDSLYCLGEVTINSKLLTFLSQQSIPIHFFNYYEYYTGTFYPKESLVSGTLLLKQAEHYQNYDKRMFLARSFVSGIIQNIIRFLEHYRKHNCDVKPVMDELESLIPLLAGTKTIPETMQLEGRAWELLYSTYGLIITGDFEFEKRSRRPPMNEINCLLSFLNSLLYTRVLSELYHTQLNPTISYLHEPFERRFSLALDISELFKPLIVQRAMVTLLNKGQIQEKHFRSDLNGCMLNEEGRKIVLQEFDSRLKLAIEHPELKRPVSYRRLIRLEGYKLIKHLIGDKEYVPFVIWW